MADGQRETKQLALLLDAKLDGLRDRMLVEIARLDSQHQAQVHAVQLVRDADHLALAELKETVRERFNSVNEFRGALADLGGTMATRRDLEALASLLTEIRSRFDQSQAQAVGAKESRSEGRASISFSTALLGTVIALAFLALALYTAFGK